MIKRPQFRFKFTNHNTDRSHIRLAGRRTTLCGTNKILSAEQMTAETIDSPRLPLCGACHDLLDRHVAQVARDQAAAVKKTNTRIEGDN